MTFKLPQSVLVVIHTVGGQVLMMERADARGYWQSVTGSREGLEEPLWETARREVEEETGLRATTENLQDWGEERTYEIFPRWRHRYAPGVTQNREHVFGLSLLQPEAVLLSPREHVAYAWLPWEEAQRRCFSWTNREAIEGLVRRCGWSEKPFG